MLFQSLISILIGEWLWRHPQRVSREPRRFGAKMFAPYARTHEDRPKASDASDASQEETERPG